jgi:hypothetical protein
MSLINAYIDITKRSLCAADATLNANIQESVGFHSYHAFESIGGALCSFKMIKYSKNHARKINQLVASSRTINIQQRTKIMIATLAIQLSSIRNECLYPKEFPGGTIRLPQQFVTLNQAMRILRQVKYITNIIQRHIN